MPRLFQAFGCKTLCADNCFYRNICFNAAVTRPIVKKKLTVKVEPTNADRCIGLIATVIEDINNIDGTGLVKVDGKIWTARSSDSSIIEKGTKVIIEKIDGVKLIVKKE